MVHRDPDTGQFVSDNDAEFSYGDTRTIHGLVHSEIPAADLGGSATTVEVFDDATKVIDFADGITGNDELFEVRNAVFYGTMTTHTTATAEGYADVQFHYGPDTETDGPTSLNAPFFGRTDQQQGIADLSNQSNASPAVWAAQMTAEGSAADSTNGLGLGAEMDQFRKMVPFGSLYGSGPVYDVDDDWYVPHEFHIDNVSDHGVQATFGALVTGITHELD